MVIIRWVAFEFVLKRGIESFQVSNFKLNCVVRRAVMRCGCVAANAARELLNKHFKFFLD
jgi:hypothetical protein